jgi:hypothetical protein
MRITGDNDEGEAQPDNFIDPESTYPVSAVTSRLIGTGGDAFDLIGTSAVQVPPPPEKSNPRRRGNGLRRGGKDFAAMAMAWSG